MQKQQKNKKQDGPMIVWRNKPMIQKNGSLDPEVLTGILIDIVGQINLIAAALEQHGIKPPGAPGAQNRTKAGIILPN